MYDGIDQISKIIGGLGEQQQIVSNNIANAQTPGYTRKNANFKDVLGNLANPFETPLSQKMGSMSHGESLGQSTGKAVNIAEEMIDMQKIYLNYSMVSRRASTIFNNIRRATQMGR